MKFPISSSRILAPSPQPAAPSRRRGCDIRYPLSTIRYSAFTLTEILVAIALLLIIMVSVSTIFRTAGQTVGMGIAITDQNRALAATGQQLQQDIIGYSDTDPYINGSGLWPVNEVPGPYAPPFLFIRNFAQSSLHDKDAAATTPFRLDSIGFFTRGAFKRQTGSTELVDQMPVFSKAYVWYGHLRLPDNATPTPNPRNPGELFPVGADPKVYNPNNFYANQWILGRRAILLTDVIPAPSPQVGTVLNAWGAPVLFYGRDTGSRNDPAVFSPLGLGAMATLHDDSGYLPGERVQESRYDIAAMNRFQSWQDYATLIQTYQDGVVVGTPGYTPWVEGRFATRPLASPTEGIDLDWNVNGDPANKTSFKAAAALSVPILLRNCTNFVVEFAGDYVDQTGAPNSNANFVVSDPSTWHLDGVIDYDLVGTVQQIHWYGLGNTVQAKRGSAMPFESNPPSGAYCCGWTKDMLCLPATGTLPTPRPSLAPKLIRITVQVSDPQGRVLDDMTRQFVFPVKYNN